MEGAFAQKNYALRIRHVDGAAVSVEVDQPATRRIETLVHAAEQCPHLPAQEQGVGLGDRTKPAFDRGLVRRADLEQTVAVLRPVDLRQQRILGNLVVAGAHRPALHVVTEIPAQRENDGALIKPGAMQREMQQFRSDNTGPVDHHADDVAASFRDAAIDGMGRRRRGGIDTDQAEGVAEILE